MGIIDGDPRGRRSNHELQACSSVKIQWRQRLKNLIGPVWTTRLRCLTRGYPIPRWGNLRRTRPFSETFGFERGTPVDRYYLHRFLERRAACIHGDVLEIQLPAYSRRYGHDLKCVHGVDINAQVRPDYVCDLAHCGNVIPDEAYDCFLLPNTLHHLKDLDACLRHAMRVIRPGGVILASAAGLVPLIPDTPEDDYWRLSRAGWSALLERLWPQCEIRVQSHGNCLAATAAILGLAAEELSPKELDVPDPRYPVLVTVFARRPA